VISPAPGVAGRFVSGTGNMFKNVGLLLGADERSRQLSREINDLTLRYRDYEELKLENTRLKAIVDYQKIPGIRFKPVSIIGQLPSVEHDGFIVDKGTADGIEKDMAVVAYDGAVLGVAGRVLEANLKTSKVLLISDTSCEITAIVQRSREQGVVTGMDGNFLVMKYLSPQADVEKGDVIITSGLGGIFPKGLRIGKVERMLEKRYALHKEAVIIPEINVRKVEELLVLKKYTYSETFTAEKPVLEKSIIVGNNGDTAR